MCRVPMYQVGVISLECGLADKLFPIGQVITLLQSLKKKQRGKKCLHWYSNSIGKNICEVAITIHKHCLMQIDF